MGHIRCVKQAAGNNRAAIKIESPLFVLRNMQAIMTD
jgi:hypothetical protein